jgi:hypothetical protein
VTLGFRVRATLRNGAQRRGRAIVVCLAFRAARLPTPAREKRKQEQRPSENEDQKRPQQQPVMPEVDKHDFLLSLARMAALYFAARKKSVNFVAHGIRSA